MNSRREELDKLKQYCNEVDKEITMILQNLQWDRNCMVQSRQMSICKFNENHKIPSDKVQEHEEMCFIKCQGYSVDDRLLPDPLDINMNTLVMLDSLKIQQIINDASQQDPLFKRGRGCVGPPPLTLERLQACYTADERRAVHDAVVSAVPSCHDLSELALLSADRGPRARGGKSRAEVLAELRDMKRRRTKYRGVARAADYCAVLRGVIATQMELYSETLAQRTIKKEQCDDTTQNEQDYTSYRPERNTRTDNSRNDKKREHEVTWIKKERDENPKERSRYDDRKLEAQDSTKCDRYDHSRYQRSEGSFKRKERDGSNTRTDHGPADPYHRRDDRYSYSSHRKKRDGFNTRTNNEATDTYYRGNDRHGDRDTSVTHTKNETTDTHHNNHDRDGYTSRRKEREYETTDTYNRRDRDRYSSRKERSTAACTNVNETTDSRYNTDRVSSSSRDGRKRYCTHEEEKQRKRRHTYERADARDSSSGSRDLRRDRDSYDESEDKHRKYNLD